MSRLEKLFYIAVVVGILIMAHYVPDARLLG